MVALSVPNLTSSPSTVDTSQPILSVRALAIAQTLWRPWSKRNMNTSKRSGIRNHANLKRVVGWSITTRATRWHSLSTAWSHHIVNRYTILIKSSWVSSPPTFHSYVSRRSSPQRSLMTVLISWWQATKVDTTCIPIQPNSSSVPSSAMPTPPRMPTLSP